MRRRTDIGSGMGAVAAFADPVGNEFGLYEELGRDIDSVRRGQ